MTGQAVAITMDSHFTAVSTPANTLRIEAPTLPCITARLDTRCASCEKNINRGERIFPKPDVVRLLDTCAPVLINKPVRTVAQALEAAAARKQSLT